jgi:hypothetical protein
MDGEDTVPVKVEAEEEAKGGHQETPHKHNPRNENP